MKISDIFKIEGENFSENLKSTVFYYLKKNSNSRGGGTFLNSKVNKISQNHISFWLIGI